MGNQEPGTEDSLGEDIEDSVGNDLSVDASLASTIGNTPDTERISIKSGGVGIDETYMG